VEIADGGGAAKSSGTAKPNGGAKQATTKAGAALKAGAATGPSAAAEEAEANGRPGPAGDTALHRGIGDIFRHDEAIDTALTANLKPRSIASQAVADRANAAFTDFNPSALSAADRARPNYLRPDDDLTESMTTLIGAGTDAMRADPAYRSLRLALSPEFKRLIKEGKAVEGAVLGTVDLRELITFVTSRPGAGPLTRNPTLTACAAEVEAEAEQRLQQVERSADRGPTAGAAGAAALGATLPSATEVHGALEAPGEPGRAEANGGGDAAKLVRDQVSLQMRTTTSPEQQVAFAERKAAFAERTDQDTHAKAVQTFELRDGPSDVTSYHDFSSLQIAFEHVWSEVFDGKLGALGRELYQEYVKLKVFTGTDDEDDRAISTLDDLRQLIDEVRTLSRMTGADIPTSLMPTLMPTGGMATSGTATAGEPFGSKELKDIAKVGSEVGKAVATIGSNVAKAFAQAATDKTVQAIVNPPGAVVDAIAKAMLGKQQLTWKSFPGPLPVNGDIIQVKVEENAMDPGVVAIALANTEATSWWKGIEFREYGADGAVVSRFKISTDPNDSDVLPLYTSQLRNGVLEFQKAAGLGFHTGLYVLGGLDQGIKDRARVTFTWVKD
jgi:hypothetical protein